MREVLRKYTVSVVSLSIGYTDHEVLERDFSRVLDRLQKYLLDKISEKTKEK